MTVPDRLVASVTAGIPIALPAQGYGASREYLQEYGAVIPFASPAELACHLQDRRAMAHLRTAAQENSHKYVGEDHLGPLAGFLRQVARG